MDLYEVTGLDFQAFKAKPGDVIIVCSKEELRDIHVAVSTHALMNAMVAADPEEEESAVSHNLIAVNMLIIADKIGKFISNFRKRRSH